VALDCSTPVSTTTSASPSGHGSLSGDVPGKGHQEKAPHVHLNYVLFRKKNTGKVFSAFAGWAAAAAVRAEAVQLLGEGCSVLPEQDLPASTVVVYL